MKHFCWLWVVLVSVANPGGAAQAREALVPAWRINAATNEVLVASEDWLDSKRARKVPVKIYAPKSGAGPFPIVIFSHGLGGSREGYEYLGQYWAAHGYVSVHLQHAGSDDGVWKDAGVGERMEAMRRATTQPRNAIDRVRDVSFAIDELTLLNATNSAWRGRLDLTRIGVAGHSFGAHTTLATAGAVYSSGLSGLNGADARVKAVIPMSAPVPASKARLDEVYAGIKIPCLHMTGTEDNSPIGDTKATERRLPFDHCANSDQFLVTFTGGDHAIFSGRGRWRGGAKDAAFQELICQSSLAFWDAYLRGDVQAKEWLTTKFKDTLGKEGVFEVKLQK